MADTNYDVAVIGSGSGGYTAAIRAAELGLKACLIEKGARLGGTCLLVGCIPTKALLFNADVYEHLKAAEEFGLEGVAGVTVNWATVQSRKDKVVSKHTKGLDYLMRKNKIDVIRGYGRLAGPRVEGVLTVDVQGGSSIRAKNVIVATGSEAKMLPGLTPDDRILTNIEILNLQEIPKSMAIVGGGPVGVEFASIYKSFGCDVTLLEALPRLVPLEDEEVSKELLRAFNKRGIHSFVATKVDTIEKTDVGVAVTFTPPDGATQSIEVDKVLIAVGRAPQTANVGLESTAVELERGFVHTDEWMETKEPGVFAVGDIIAGFPQLAHVAFMQGMVAAARIAGQPARPLNHNRIPSCTYCEPQVASVGLTETRARADGRDVKVGKFPFQANPRASILGSHDGFVKVIADAHTGELVGVHIIGAQATEMIAEAVVAMDAEATIDTLMFSIHPHPTLSEAMFDGIEMVRGLSINI